MTDTFEEQARKIIEKYGGNLNSVEAAIRIALTDAYKRGQRDMQERAANKAQRMADKQFAIRPTDAEGAMLRRWCGGLARNIGDAIAALPIAPDEKEGG